MNELWERFGEIVFDSMSATINWIFSANGFAWTVAGALAAALFFCKI